MNKYAIRWVEGFRDFLGRSSVRWHLFLGGLIGLGAYLPPLVNRLPEAAAWLNANWPTLQPFLEQWFPSVTQANWLLIAKLIGLLFQATVIISKKRSE